MHKSRFERMLDKADNMAVDKSAPALSRLVAYVFMLSVFVSFILVGTGLVVGAGYAVYWLFKLYAEYVVTGTIVIIVSLAIFSVIYFIVKTKE